MESKKKFKNCNNNISKKVLIFKYLILLLSFIKVKPFRNQKNNLILFSGLNQILLKVKGNNFVKILNPYYNCTPTSYNLNNNPNQITFNSASIQITSSENENEVTLLFENEVESCNSMFKGCSHIIEIDLTNFRSSNVRNIDSMFEDCTSLKKIKFGNFRTSNIHDNMEKIFYGLDLSSFRTSHIEYFRYNFDGCSSLKYLDLSNFDAN